MDIRYKCFFSMDTKDVIGTRNMTYEILYMDINVDDKVENRTTMYVENPLEIVGK